MSRREKKNKTNIVGKKKVPYDEIILKDGIEYKYCRVCTKLLLLTDFHKHKQVKNSWKSGHQFECKKCKNTKINPLLNPLRTSDQMRESSEGSRLRGIVIPKGKMDSYVIFKKFKNKCFKCKKHLDINKKGTYEIDHTLPHSLWWGYSTEDATLLCYDHNQEKTNKWPSEYYTTKELIRLSKLTGWDFDLLNGKPTMCKENVDRFLNNRNDFEKTWLKRGSGKKFLIKETKKLKSFGFIK